MNYQSIIFDLDGTLLESTADHIEWIYNCCRNALEKQGVETDLSHRELNKLLGMEGYEPYISSCKKAEVSPETHWDLVTDLRYQKKSEMLQNNSLDLYPETKQIIKELHTQGLKIGVVSNAPEKTVEEIISFFELDRYVHFYRGISSYEELKNRKPSPKYIKLAVSELKNSPSIYIGNKKQDVIAAKNAGIDSLIINRNNTELDTNPDYLIETITEMSSTLN